MSWLFIAKYDHQAWKNFSIGEEDEAREAAEVLFPYEGVEQSRALIAFKVVDTFRTKVFEKLPPSYKNMPKADRARLLDEVLANLPAGDQGIGWIAIVPDSEVNSFNSVLGDNDAGNDRPLKRMYTIERFHLNDDQTTKDVYEHMSPTHWGSGGGGGT
jgi:hypothetical protein